jgi:hypothetical protein
VKVNIDFKWSLFIQKYNLDDQGAPYCCGGPIPEEFVSQYGGYEDDIYDAAESINKM